MSKLEELAVDHPYYSSDSNYYSNEASYRWESMTDYLDDMFSSDVDMNLCFRWDVKQHEDDDGKPTGGYYAEVFIIHQRKGIYSPHYIESIKESECDRFIEYLNNHWETMLELWKPIAPPQ